jgi:hypothetical protein
MRKIMKNLCIIQEKKFLDEFKHTRIKRRLNPYNPLTYIAIVMALIIGVFMFGFFGLKNEININELKFKWILI